ncbi:phage tail tape measure protein [Virgibacillus profundi]|nr:phage tail tape measure protein [Virgibacillus profundi]
MDSFGIKLTTTVDGSSIQSQLKAISKRLKPIRIKVNMDDKALKSIRTFNKEMRNLRNTATDTGKQVNKSLTPNTKKSQKEIDNLKKSVSQMGDSQKKAVEGVTGAQSKQKKSLSEVVRGWQKLNQEVTKYNKKGEAEITQKYSKPNSEDVLTVTKTPKDELLRYNIAENHLKLEKRQQAEALKSKSIAEQLIATQERLRLKLQQMGNQGQLSAQSLSRMGNSVNTAKSVAQLNKLETQLKRVEASSKSLQAQRALESRVNNARAQFETNTQKLTQGLAGNMSPKHTEQLTNLTKQYNRLNSLTPDVMNKTKALSRQFSLLAVDVRKADAGMSRFAGQTASAMLRIPIYAAGMAAMYAPIIALRDALRQIVELDSQMTVLERVSNGTIQINDAMESSIDIAERLGNTIGEVNEGLIAFARQGYRGTDLSAITEVATVMGNVSDLTVDDSASALTAAMKGFNIEAEDSIRIVDQLNEVDKFIVPYVSDDILQIA